MSGFFSKSHELVPEPVTDQNDYSYCTGSVNNVSFSGLMNFEKCPYSLFLDKVSRIARVNHPAANRGTQIHDMLEQYVNGTLDETEMNWSLLKSNVFHQHLINTFRTDYEQGLVIPELKYAITKELKPTKWDSRTMWHRGAIDVVLFKDSKKTQAIIFDYKTGQTDKVVTHKSQLMLYALIMFILYKKLDYIQAAPIYLDHKLVPFFANFYRRDFDMFFPRWKHRLSQVTDATVFPAIPNQFNCKWCQHKIAQPDLNQTEPACSFGVI